MDLISALPQIKHAADQLQWGNLQGAALPLAIAQLLQQHDAPYLLLVPDTPTALRLEQELGVFYQQDGYPILTLPDWETLPYDVFSPHKDTVSQGRSTTPYQPSRMTRGLAIVPVSNPYCCAFVIKSSLEQNSFLIKKGQQVDLAGALKRQLTAVGYRSVEQVMEHGEFSARGSILDLYPMGANTPFRIDFFDNDVDGIRTFDPDNQRSSAGGVNLEIGIVACARTAKPEQSGDRTLSYGGIGNVFQREMRKNRYISKSARGCCLRV